VPLSPPPRDGANNVVPHDHQEIANDDDLIRRISEEQTVVDDKGVRRVSSMAFNCSTGPDGGMSVDIKRSIEEVGDDAATFVTTPRWIGSVIFKVGVPRSLGFQVGYDPIPGNDHHGEVWGKSTKATKKRIQSAARWFVQIPDVVL
jgi:hypothetical protein